MLATLLHMMKGTPYVYQGEEIGMTNVSFDSIEDYRDIETLNAYDEMKEEGKPEEDIMESIHAKSRDNARTPMQWDTSENAGFTTGEPWIKVNPNYTDINAEEAVKDTDSIYHYYRTLISLRKHHDVIVDGKYTLILEDHPEIYAYTRTLGEETLLVICNFYDGEPEIDWPEDLRGKEQELLIANYLVEEPEETTIKLRPYEARVYLMK